MPGPADVANPALRSLLVEAEQAIDEGDYVKSVHGSVDAYTRLIEERPDVFVSPVDRRGELPSPSQLRVAGGLRPWPTTLGVVLDFDADQKPHLRFEKDHFTMTEAMTYLEYTLEMVTRAERSQ